MNDDNIQNGQLVDTREHRVPDKQFFDQAKANRKLEIEAESAAFNELRRKNAERLAKTNEAFLAKHREDVSDAEMAENAKRRKEAALREKQLEQIEADRLAVRNNPLH